MGSRGSELELRQIGRRGAPNRCAGLLAASSVSLTRLRQREHKHGIPSRRFDVLLAVHRIRDRIRPHGIPERHMPQRLAGGSIQREKIASGIRAENQVARGRERSRPRITHHFELPLHIPGRRLKGANRTVRVISAHDLLPAASSDVLRIVRLNRRMPLVVVGALFARVQRRKAPSAGYTTSSSNSRSR